MILVPQALLPTGIRTVGPVSVPDGSAQVTLGITHGGGTVPGFFWGLMVSVDGGTTWIPLGSAGTVGPQPSAESSVTVGLPPGVGRLVQAFLWVSQATTVALTLTPV